MTHRVFLDHIAITAPSLAAGAAYIREALGVTPQVGGEHPRMSTHNCLLRLGDTTYLEIIAPNPAAPAPERPRWFELDRLRPDSTPRLSAWVARTTDIAASVAAASEPLGKIEPMSRGTLDWLITIPADGSLPLAGAGPALIQWRNDTHPAGRLEDKGVSLTRLEIHHPEPERVSRLLRSLALEAPVAAIDVAAGARARLAAHFETPHGTRVIC